MTGADLYLMYENANTAHGIGVDLWDELDDSDREVWDLMAKMVVERTRGKAEE